VLLFVVVNVIVTGILFGIGPALHSTGANLGSLKEDSRGAAPRPDAFRRSYTPRAPAFRRAQLRLWWLRAGQPGP
jgi:hypothetical protein